MSISNNGSWLSSMVICVPCVPDVVFTSNLPMSVKKSGVTVTFVTDSGAQYQWLWDGKVTTWAKLMIVLNISEQV